MGRFSKIFGLVGVLALVLVLPAQGAFIYKTGARPASMGGSFVAVVDDANAIFLNPSGLTQLSGKALTTTYARLFPCVEEEKLHQGMVGFVLPMGGVGVLGLGWQKFMSDLGRLKATKQAKPAMKIAVAGCMAQQMGKELFKKSLI